MRVENIWKVIDIPFSNLSEQTKQNLIPEYIDRNLIGEHIIHPWNLLKKIPEKERKNYTDFVKDLEEMSKLVDEHSATYVRITK